MNIAIEELKKTARKSKDAERQREEKEMDEFKKLILENVVELLKEDPRIKLGNPTQLCFYISYNESKFIMTTREVPHKIKDYEEFWFSPLYDDPIGENEKRISLPSQIWFWPQPKTLDLVSEVLKSGEILLPTSKKVDLFLRLSCYRVVDRLFRTYVIDLCD